jgi:hypothetical protein
LSLLGEPFQEGLNGGATNPAPLHRTVDNKAAEPDRAVFTVDCPHNVADNGPADLNGKRMPCGAIVGKAQVIRNRSDKSFLAWSGPDRNHLTPIRAVNLYEPHIGVSTSHDVNLAEPGGPPRSPHRPAAAPSQPAWRFLR